jgi:tetratricopeptide (TPR) repeat protein
LRQALPLDGPAKAAASANDRALDFPDGDVGLELEPGEGDVFYAASEVTLLRGGDFLLWLEGAAALEARIDGSVVLSRAPYPRESPRAQTVPVRLAKGLHQLLVRWSRAEGARFRATLVRGDGGPSDLSSAAPAGLSGSRASAPCALGDTCTAAPAWRDAADLREAASALLERDPGDPLASWLLARASIGDDRKASRAAVDRTVALCGGSAPALALRSQQLLHDPEMPDRISRARALSDLLEAARKDPSMLRVRLTAAALERDSERFDDAAQNLDKAEAALREAKQPLPQRLLAARARLLDARGNAAGAKARAEAALKAGPGRCETLQLLLEIARRDGSLADQQRFTDALTPCPDGLATQAHLARDRGHLMAAEELWRLSAALRPAQPARLEQLAEVQAARKQVPSAVASVRAAAALAPRSPEPQRRLAGLLELLGETKGAQEARRAALRLAPADLQLRQQLALDEGARLLSWTDRDAVALAKAPARADSTAAAWSGCTRWPACSTRRAWASSAKRRSRPTPWSCTCAR